jgi:CRP-like cAMP-binding protein
MNSDDVVGPLLRRLRLTAEIDEGDEQAVGELPIAVKRVASGTPIARYGDRSSACCLVIEGFVLRAKFAGDGDRRQILSFHQPGDIPDLQSLFLHVMDHDVCAMGDAVLGFIPHDPLRNLIRARPNVAVALWRDTLTDAAIFRE